jgi:DNA (cytosine-5)-methyltransferase 1
MGEGLTYSQLPEVLKRYRDDIFDDKYNRLRWDDRSRSITAHIAKDGYWYIHPEEHRTLTVREAARIQTFPDEFRFSGGRSDAFRLIGNAVPPLLGEMVASALRTGTKQQRPTDRMLASVRRSAIRRSLLKWAAERPAPAWRRPGEPWAVLVGTLAGRTQEAAADELLDRFAAPAEVTPGRLATLTKRAATDRQLRVLRSLGAAARNVNRHGWDNRAWAKAGGVGPADTVWIEAVGLGFGHIPATAGTVRVAARTFGEPGAGGVGGRLLLAQLLGHTETTSSVIAAAAGLAHEVCRPVALCSVCPLSDLCLSAGSTTVTT